MKKEYFQLSAQQREEIKHQITEILEKREDVLFAYIYGSFQNDASFRDIDIAVFVEPKVIALQNSIEYELSLSAKLVFSFPIDLRVLNNTPRAFQNNVARTGTLLFVKDRKLHEVFLEESSLYMLENAHIIREAYAALVT